jgi:carboxypeptidase family protein
MLTNGKGVFRTAWLIVCVIVAGATLVLAQGALGTFNGRVLDQGDAVLPGVAITATNTGTNVARTTVTNAEGLYNLPALDPGVYTIQAELSGFATSTRTGVTLGVNQTITIDIKLGLAGVAENITVSGASPLIEVTQSLVSATIRAREVVNLPLITRNLNGLLGLIPGSKPVAAFHPAKKFQGSVSFGGSGGRNVVPVVDGGDIRDNIVGGAMINLTVEGIEEFQVATHQFTAADGRSSGASVNILTKSGTNALRGSGFFFDRDKAMTAKDYYTKRDKLTELPYNRQQYGGSVGGPIVRNRAFFFAAAEGIREDTAITIPDKVYNEFKLLEPFGAKIEHSIDKPYWDAMYTGKGNIQLSQNQSLIARFAGQKNSATNGAKTQGIDLSSTAIEHNNFWDAVGQHSWTIGNRALNQFTVHANHLFALRDASALSGGPYFANYPNVTPFPATQNLVFPFGRTGAPQWGAYHSQNMWQFKDNVTLQLGSHGVKMGGDYSWMPTFGGILGAAWGQFTFFDDPSVIINNSSGKYPQGFETPGAVRQWTEGADIIGVNYSVYGARQVGAFIQDDWRVGRRLTLNLGVRYDVDINFYSQPDAANGLTGQALRAIGSPYGGFAQTPTKDISPRVGFAYDTGGDGRRVLRGGYGLYFGRRILQDHYQSSYMNNRPVSFDAILTNTAVGKGELATYRFGIDPPPPQPPAVTEFPGALPPGQGVAGAWIDPNNTDPSNHQFHIGYSHELAPSTVLSADYTHIRGVHEFYELQINTFKDGVRRLAPAFAAVYGDANLLGPIRIESSNNRSRYDELAVQFERRLERATLRVIYTLSGAYAYTGSISGTAAENFLAQDQDDLFAPGEWGPTASDERHRLVVFGVFDLPFGLQVSPVFQAATPRPYNLIAGVDLNADGQLNDRYVDPATGQQVSVNSQRGDPFWLLDARVTKFFTVGQESRKFSVFAEFFNLFNTANFGREYQGNARSVVFRQPTGLMPGAGYPFQLQVGARFEF